MREAEIADTLAARPQARFEFFRRPGAEVAQYILLDVGPDLFDRLCCLNLAPESALAQVRELPPRSAARLRAECSPGLL